MRKAGAVEKNLDLAHRFLLYSFEHPEVLEAIPPSAEVIFFPDGDRPLLMANKRLAERLRRKGRKVVVFRVSPATREIREFQELAA